MVKKVKEKVNTTRTRTLVLIYSFAMVTLFTIAVLIINAFGNDVSDQLITCVFAFYGVELWQLASITKTKIKNINNDEEE